MLRRLLLGLVEGIVIGAALVAAVSRGLGLVAPGALVLALLAAATGFLVGLVAGRPIWSPDAKTEAFLKAVAGSIVGFGASFALRHFLTPSLDLSAFSLGAGSAGQLPAVTLPAIATALALFFELDHDGSSSHSKARVFPREKQRVASHANADPLADLDELEQHEVDHRREKR